MKMQFKRLMTLCLCLAIVLTLFPVIAPVTALLNSKVTAKRCVAHPELGMEAFYELQVEKFPCIIAAAHGESMF